MVTSERIKQYREAARLSQAALAGRLGVTREAVTNWERGTSQPREAMLPLLASALGVTVDELLATEGDEQVNEPAGWSEQLPAPAPEQAPVAHQAEVQP